MYIVCAHTYYVRIRIQMPDSEVFITKHGKINFVDLAGSEMTKKTNSSGKTLKEANNINKSLMVLGKLCVQIRVPTSRPRPFCPPHSECCSRHVYVPI